MTERSTARQKKVQLEKPIHRTERSDGLLTFLEEDIAMTIHDGCALSRLRQGLKRHFGSEAGMFVDPFLWLIGCVCVDIVRLDNWLMRRNSDYREDESMRLFIRRKYGRNAERFVAYWLKGEQVQGSPLQGAE